MFGFQRALQKRIEKGNFRRLSLHADLADFYSNDYLSLANHPDLSLSVSVSGSSGSRLLSGNSPEAMQCESILASHFQAESALVFNSGYDANLGFFSSVPQRGDTILYDELIHASARDGIRLSLAHSFSFRHSDLDQLEARLKSAKGTVFVAVESLYSMDGDLAPLLEIQVLCNKYGSLLVVDEAHSGGVFGDFGKGICHQLGIENQVFARLITFGKAFGSHGAAVLGSDDLIQFLINFSRSFIYTTALPPAHYSHVISAIQFEGIPNLQAKLLQNIRFFRSHFENKLVISDTCSPIQIFKFPGNDACRTAAERLQSFGFHVKPILSPTVSEGNERLRICIHAHNTQEEIDRLAIELVNIHK